MTTTPATVSSTSTPILSSLHVGRSTLPSCLRAIPSFNARAAYPEVALGFHNHEDQGEYETHMGVCVKELLKRVHEIFGKDHLRMTPTIDVQIRDPVNAPDKWSINTYRSSDASPFVDEKVSRWPIGETCRIFTVCETGAHCSQLFRFALLQMKEQAKQTAMLTPSCSDIARAVQSWKVEESHGTENSVDPWVLPTMTCAQIEQCADKKAVSSEIVWVYDPLVSSSKEMKQMKVAIGYCPSRRACETELIDTLTAAKDMDQSTIDKSSFSIPSQLIERSILHCKQARDFMTERYWGDMITCGKLVVIYAFERSVWVVLTRLLETIVQLAVGDKRIRIPSPTEVHASCAALLRKYGTRIEIHPVVMDNHLMIQRPERLNQSLPNLLAVITHNIRNAVHHSDVSPLPITSPSVSTGILGHISSAAPHVPISHTSTLSDSQDVRPTCFSARIVRSPSMLLPPPPPAVATSMRDGGSAPSPPPLATPRISQALFGVADSKPVIRDTASSSDISGVMSSMRKSQYQAEAREAVPVHACPYCTFINLPLAEYCDACNGAL